MLPLEFLLKIKITLTFHGLADSIVAKDCFEFFIFNRGGQEFFEILEKEKLKTFLPFCQLAI